MTRGVSLHIGLNSVDKAAYGGWDGQLVACENDARSMENLTSSLGYRAQNLITDHAKSTAVIRAIEGAARDLEKGDIFVLTYSGHGGQVPDTMADLVQLPGVGRKTANVILGNACDVPGITVDTHVLRLSHRMGLTKQTDAHKVEQDLMTLMPKKEWTMFSHRMIFHGRQVCFARKPNCPGCILAEVCPKIGVKL